MNTFKLKLLDEHPENPVIDRAGGKNAVVRRVGGRPVTEQQWADWVRDQERMAAHHRQLLEISREYMSGRKQER